MKPTSSILSLLLLFPVASVLAAPPVVDIQGEKTETKGNVVHAQGRVRITHLDNKISADKATYDKNAKKIILDGNVVVTVGSNEHRSEKVIYHLDTQKVEVKGPNRTILRSL